MRALEALFLLSVFYAGCTSTGLNLAVRILHINTATAGSPSLPSSSATSRFPLYGTAEYAKVCPWVGSVADSSPAATDCSILLRPDPIFNNEGVSWWATEAAYGMIMSRLIGCDLLLDYMPDVKIGDILKQPRGRTKATWATSSNYTCTASRRCYLIDRPKCRDEEGIAELRDKMLEEGIGRELVRIPQYRFGYYSQLSAKMSKWKLYHEDYRQLAEAIPNFDLQTGHSCALTSLFELNEDRAGMYEPELFSHILPTLRDENNLVITLYYRSNYADSRARAEKEGKDFVEGMRSPQSAVKGVIECALGREEEFLSRRNHVGETGERTKLDKDERTSDFQSIVWLVVSDSVTVKEWIADEFSGNNTNARIAKNQQRYPGKVIPRHVLTTTARGVHTRAKRKTSTTDFAEAMIDWWLIGESDVVVSSGSMSFGETAALRTQRPIYLIQNHQCSRYNLILPPRDNSTSKEGTDNAKKPRIRL